MEEIKKNLKKFKWDSIITSVLTIILGILAVVMPSNLGDVLCYIFGAMLLIIGLTLIIKYFAVDRLLSGYSLFFGMILVIVGIFCFASTISVQNILTILFGLFIVIDSINSLTDSVICARMQVKGWILMFILSLITAIFGIVVMFGSFDTIMIIAGCALIIEGIRNLVITLVFSRKIRVAKNNLRKLYNETFIDGDVNK